MLYSLPLVFGRPRSFSQASCPPKIPAYSPSCLCSGALRKPSSWRRIEGSASKRRRTSIIDSVCPAVFPLFRAIFFYCVSGWFLLVTLGKKKRSILFPRVFLCFCSQPAEHSSWESSPSRSDNAFCEIRTLLWRFGRPPLHGWCLLCCLLCVWSWKGVHHSAPKTKYSCAARMHTPVLLQHHSQSVTQTPSAVALCASTSTARPLIIGL